MIVYPRLSVLINQGSANIADPLSVTTTWGSKGSWVLSGVYILFSAAVTETFTVTLDSGYASTNDCVFKSESLTGATSTSYIPTNVLIIPKGSDIVVGVTSATATGTAGYTIVGYEC